MAISLINASVGTKNPKSLSPTSSMASLSASSSSDLYDEVVERKQESNDWYAKLISKFTNNKERPDSSVIASFIGGVGGIFQAGFLAILHYKFLNKNSYILEAFEPEKGDSLFLKLQKWYFRLKLKRTENWTNKFDLIKNIKNPALKASLGIGVSLVAGAITGIAMGFGWSIYDKFSKTSVNGKVSHISKKDMQLHPILARLNEFVKTENGKSAFKNSIVKNDDGSVTFKFRGLNKEYTFTRDELIKANEKYITKLDENGKIDHYIKRYTNSDGDVLAFELAYIKLRKEISPKEIKSNLENVKGDKFAYILTGENPN